MSDLYGLKLEPMPNRLVNYGVTENGIAVIELTSDSAGAPLEDHLLLPALRRARRPAAPSRRARPQQHRPRQR